MTSRLFDRVVAATLIVIPLIIIPRMTDSFRVPKMSALIAAGFILIVLGFSRLPRLVREHRHVTILIGAIVSWTLIGTLLSVNRSLSLRSLIIVIASAAIFLAMLDFFERHSIVALWLIIAPAAINALFVMLQRLGWNPMHPLEKVPLHITYSALIGNPDDVCTYLAPAGLIAFIAALKILRPRVLAWIAAIVIPCGMIASNSLTGLIAYGAGMITVALVITRKRSLIAIAALIIVAAASVLFVPTLAKRMTHIRERANAGKYNDMISGRLTPTITALLMARDHPVFGAGPGTFRFLYFDTKIRAEERFPDLLGITPMNFGETHDDYAQVLAESGIPGFALLLASIFILARLTLRATNRFVQLLAHPLAITFVLVCTTQFPLRLASTLIVFLSLAAVCIARSGATDAA